MKNYTKERITNQLRIHWHWLKKRESKEIAAFIIATIEKSEKDNEKVKSWEEVNNEKVESRDDGGCSTGLNQD